MCTRARSGVLRPCRNFFILYVQPQKNVGISKAIYISNLCLKNNCAQFQKFCLQCAICIMLL